MKKLSSMLVIILIIFPMMCFAALASGEGARIWTDKDDYAPYETVTIFGEGFLPNRQVTIIIMAPDSSIDTIYAWTNGSGAFSAEYVLDGMQGTYTVTATDGTNVATTTFVDRVWSVSVSPNAATVPQGSSTTATVSVTANPSGGPEVDLWASGQPAGVAVSFNPVRGVPPFTSIMNISVGPSATPGTYIIIIIVFTGVPGHPSYSEKARTNFTLTITGAPPATVSITITSSPVTGAGFVKVDGTSITTPTTFTWTVGSTHTLEALSPVAGPIGTRYVWTSWSDGGAQTHTYTVPSSSETVTAYYKTQYLVSFTQIGAAVAPTVDYQINTGPIVTGTVPFDVWVDSGKQISYTYQAIVSDGSGVRYALVGVSPASPQTVTGPLTITGTYKTQYQITVTANPSQALGGTFKVTYTSCGTTYNNVEKTTPWTEWADAGTTVTVSEPQGVISVSSGMRYKFDSYSPSASVTMNQAKTITLVYKTQYYLTVRADPPGITTIPGEGWYNATSTVSLLAPSVPNYEFKNWTVDGSFVPGNPINVPMDNPHTAIAYYTLIPPLSVSITPTTAKIKVGESVTFTSSVSGGKPPYSYQWYLNGSAVSGATSSAWTFTPTATGYYIVYLNVTDGTPQTVKSNEASVTVAPQLTVSISPMSAAIVVGQSVDFTSMVSGGYPPYSYQWYLNGAPVSGATSSSWKFTPIASGVYYVYLKVTDANNNVVQSDVAKISAASVPVGGYSISFVKQNPVGMFPIVVYVMLIAMFSAALSLVKRRRK